MPDYSPFRALKPLPILTPSNLVPTTSFQRKTRFVEPSRSGHVSSTKCYLWKLPLTRVTLQCTSPIKNFRGSFSRSVAFHPLADMFRDFFAAREIKTTKETAGHQREADPEYL